MSEDNNNSEQERQRPPEPSERDNAYTQGFEEGFSRARQIFWRDFMRKAEDARIASAQLRSASEDNEEQAIYFALLDSTYITAAHTVARSHTLYPGAVKDPETQGDKELYGHRDWQIDWDDPANHAHCGNTYCECTLHHH